MPTNPRRYSRKRNEDGSSDPIGPTAFAAVTDSSFYRGIVDQICDSAFLAERGIFTRMESPKHSFPPDTHAYNRRGQAA
jgi:hypothetical protein